MKAPSGHWGWVSIYPNTAEIIHTSAGTATPNTLRLRLHSVGAHAVSVIQNLEIGSLSKYRFKPSERYAVFTVHGEICYLCRKPVDMATFQVDHIIPESLESKKETLKKALDSYGLDGSFNRGFNQ